MNSFIHWKHFQCHSRFFMKVSWAASRAGWKSTGKTCSAASAHFFLHLKRDSGGWWGQFLHEKPTSVKCTIWCHQWTNPHSETFPGMMGQLPGRHKKGNKSLLKRIKSPHIKYFYTASQSVMNEMEDLFLMNERGFLVAFKAVMSCFWNLTQKEPPDLLGSLLWSSGTSASGSKGNQHISELTHNGLEQWWWNGNSLLKSSHFIVQAGPPPISSSLPMTKLLPKCGNMKASGNVQEKLGFCRLNTFQRSQPPHAQLFQYFLETWTAFPYEK